MIRKLLASLVSIFSYAFFCTQTSASPFGLNISYVGIPKDPENLHGYRLAATYQPPCFIWQQISVYFDASYGHWWVPGGGPYSSLSSYAIAPYLRYYILKHPIASPYVEVSIGPTYLSKTHISDQSLGMHFSFQDQASIGSEFGKDQKWNAAITVLHYSNGSLSAHNSGITVPLMLNVGYRF